MDPKISPKIDSSMQVVSDLQSSSGLGGYGFSQRSPKEESFHMILQRIMAESGPEQSHGKRVSPKGKPKPMAA